MRASRFLVKFEAGRRLPAGSPFGAAATKAATAGRFSASGNQSFFDLKPEFDLFSPIGPLLSMPAGFWREKGRASLRLGRSSSLGCVRLMAAARIGPPPSLLLQNNNESPVEWG